MIRGNLLVSAFMIVTFLAMIFASLQYPHNAGLAPVLVALPGLILSAWQFAADLRDHRRLTSRRKTDRNEALTRFDPAKTPSVKPSKKAATVRAELIMFGWVLLILVLFLFLGFWVGLAVFLPLFLVLFGRESWKTTLLVSTAGWLGFYIVFHLLLKVLLFRGFLHEWFL
jgi:hypothetical protein